MIPISSGLSDVLVSTTQSVSPYALATWADSRIMENMVAYSSSDLYSTKTKSLAPILWWKFNYLGYVGSGDIEDWSGNDNHGTSNNIVNYGQPSMITETGILAYSTMMSYGATPSAVSLADETSLNPTDNFMLEAWVNFNAGDPTAVYSGSNVEYALVAKASGDAASARQYGFYATKKVGDLLYLSAKVYSGSVEYKLESSTPVVFPTGADSIYYLSLVVKSGKFYFIVNDTILGPTTVGAIQAGGNGSFAVGKNGSSSIKRQITANSYNIEHVALYSSASGSTIPSSLSLTTRYLSGRNSGDMAYPNSYFDASQVGNGLSQESFLWTALDAKDKTNRTITANGKYNLAESDIAKRKFEYGWWSRQRSTSGGNLIQYELVSIEFDARIANYIDIYTSEEFGGIRTFDVGYLNSSNVWTTVASSVALPEDEYFYRQSLGSELTISGIFVKVYDIYTSMDVARIQEISPIYVEDISDDILDINVSKVRENYDSSLPVGTTSANSASISVDNTDKSYSRRNASGPRYGYLEPEVKIETGLAYDVPTTAGTDGTYGIGTYGDGTYGTGGVSGSGTVETIPLGTFYTDNLNIDSSGMRATFSARDRSKYLQETTVAQGLLFQDTTVGQAIGNIAKYGNIPYSQISYQKRFNDLMLEKVPQSYWRFNDGAKKCRGLYSGDGDAEVISNLNFNSNYPYPTVGSLIGAKVQGISYYPELNTDTIAGYTHDLTIEGWFKIATGYDSEALSNRSLFRFENTAGDSIIAIKNPGNLTVTIGGVDAAVSSQNIVDAGWTHIALTVVGGGGFSVGASIEFALFVNGVKVQWTYVDSITKIISNFFDKWTWLYHIKGEVSDIRVWNCIRTDQEIADNMSLKLRGHETNLLSYWPCDDITDTNDYVDYAKNKTFPGYFLAASGDTTNTQRTKMPLNPLMKFRDTGNYSHLTDPSDLAIMAQPGPLANDSTSLSATVNGANIFGTTTPTFRLPYFSFIGFIKPTDVDASSSAPQYIFSGGPNIGSLSAYITGYNTTSADLVVKIEGSPSDYTLSTATSSNGAIQQGVWNMVCIDIVTGFGAAYVNIYVGNSTIGSLDLLASGFLTCPGSLFPDKVTFGGNYGANYFIGNISEFAIFDRIMTLEDYQELYQASVAQTQHVYPYLWTSESSLWDSMLSWATPDLGTFFFNESDYFVYDSGNTLYDTAYPQHAVSQITISDDDFIISGSENITIMANTINCKVYGLSQGISTQVIWQAPDGSTLGVCQLKAAITKYDTTVTHTYVDGTDNSHTPIFGQTGYIKIDNEIIQFNSYTKGTFGNCVRGALGTTAVEHTINTPLYETRTYDIVYQDKPVLSVKNPYITQQYYDKIVVEKWETSAFGGKLTISAKDASGSATPYYIYISGTELVGNLTNSTAVAGVVLKTDSSNQTVGNETTNLANQVRRFKIKSIDIDSPYVTSTTHAKEIIDFIIAHFANGAEIITVEVMGIPHLQLGDRITIGNFDQLGIVDTDFWVIGNSVSYDGGVRQTLTLREAN